MLWVESAVLQLACEVVLHSMPSIHNQRKCSVIKLLTVEEWALGYSAMPEQLPEEGACRGVVVILR